jgi:glycosyltransferase involved in cell wall biosynthesis
MYKKPLLTIGIPTYNRAEYLESLLENICRQIEKIHYNVEVVISDNCSNDKTIYVGERYSKSYKFIKYHRNNENIGLNNNLKLVTTKLSQGKFCWAIGDDDVIRDNGIENICNVLNKYSDLGCIILNYGKVTNINGRIHQIEDSLALNIKEDVLLDKWEKVMMLPAKNQLTLFTGFFSQIMTTENWIDQYKLIPECDHDNIISETEPCLNCTFPFFKIFAVGCIGKPTYVISKPFFFQGIWAQTALQYSLLHEVVLYYKFIEFFSGLKIDHLIINQLEEVYYRNFGGFFLKYCESNPFSEEMEQVFYDHFARLSKEKKFWQSIKRAVQNGDRDSGVVKQYYRRLISNQMLKDMLSGEKGLVVWGYGELGKQIVDGLDDLKDSLVAVVDVDPAKDGQLVPKSDICVSRPESLCNMGKLDIILIASLAHEKSIIDTIRNELKLKSIIISASGIYRYISVIK